MIKKGIQWFAALFDSESTKSMKRFIACLMMFWSLTMGTYYILKVQWGGVESTTTVSLLEFVVVSAVGLLAGGTAAEALKKRAQKLKEKDEKAI